MGGLAPPYCTARSLNFSGAVTESQEYRKYHFTPDVNLIYINQFTIIIAYLHQLL
jgi:hypothetical protein